MLKKSMLITAMCLSSMSLTGCSSIWSGVSVFADDMSELTSMAWLRGSSTKSDINFAKNADPKTNAYKTDVGEYVPANVTSYGNVELFDTASTFDTSPVPCPEDTYMTKDKTCALLENETYDFADITSDTVSLPVDTSPLECPEGTYMAEDNTCMFFDNEATNFASEFADQDVSVVVDTSQHECPEGTFLNAENACMYLETETYDFAEDITVDANVVIDTSPVSCPEGTVLNAENTCMYLETETLDFASDVTSDAATISAPALITPTPANYSVTPSNNSVRLPLTQCPEGFKSDGKNACMYLGASLEIK